MSKFVSQVFWEDIKREELSLQKEFSEADTDLGNWEVKEDFADIEGEDFPEL